MAANVLQWQPIFCNGNQCFTAAANVLQQQQCFAMAANVLQWQLMFCNGS